MFARAHLISRSGVLGVSEILLEGVGEEDPNIRLKKELGSSRGALDALLTTNIDFSRKKIL